MNFEKWKSLRPTQEMAERLGFKQPFSQTSSWSDYASTFGIANSDGQLIEAATRLFGKLSSSERSVVAAMLHAADFSDIADDLTGANTWSGLSHLSGDYALAVSLAIAQR